MKLLPLLSSARFSLSNKNIENNPMHSKGPVVGMRDASDAI